VPDFDPLRQSGIDHQSHLCIPSPGLARSTLKKRLLRAIQTNPIISCVIYLPFTQIRPGVIDCGATHWETLNLLEVGTRVPQACRRANCRSCREGGEATVYDDIQPQRWSKLVVNAGWSPITALSLCSDADFLRSSPGAVDLVRRVMFEVVALARALKIEGIDEDLAEPQLNRHWARTGRQRTFNADGCKGRPPFWG
jgi:2-dehydropantoate 2-reductase